MHESVNEDDPQGAALTPAGPDVCFHTGHVLKLCKDKRGEVNGRGLMWGRGGEGVMHFSTHHGFVRNPAGQVRERSECKRKKGVSGATRRPGNGLGEAGDGRGGVVGGVLTGCRESVAPR